MTTPQLDRFDRVLRSLRAARLMPADALAHAASSGPVWRRLRRSFYDMVRVGGLVMDHGSDNEANYTTANAHEASVSASLLLGSNPHRWGKWRRHQAQVLIDSSRRVFSLDDSDSVRPRRGGYYQTRVTVKKRLPQGYCIGYFCQPWRDHSQTEAAYPLAQPANALYLEGVGDVDVATGHRVLLRGPEHSFMAKAGAEAAGDAVGWVRDKATLVLAHGLSGLVALVHDDRLFAHVKEGDEVRIEPEEVVLPTENRLAALL